MNSDPELLEQILDSIFSNHVKLLSVKNVSGGSINRTLKLITSSGLYFLKLNSASLYPGMFDKEKRGLQLLADTKTIDVPKVIDTGIIEDTQYLLLSFENTGVRKRDFWKTFAENLCSMHDNTSSFYGLDHDNYIGSIKQSNTFSANWVEFFIRERLMPQLSLALQSGLAESSLGDDFEKFIHKLPQLLSSESPSLLHGDLWSGNFLIGEKGEAMIFDPAVYYGHREVDLAFTKLFGGFENEFYDAYEHAHPLLKGYKERLEIYNLYPLLVHLNLFGQGYLGGIKSILNIYK
jgi:protein-ribulosamine 3-kinase